MSKQFRFLSIAVIAVLFVVVGCGNNPRQPRRNIQQISGTFTDSRNGQTYRTVKIGNRTWMAENLNFQTENSWCYDNNSANCSKYGRLYTWDAAMKACPSGWRLPSDNDWTALTNAVGSNAGTKLKSQTGWNDNGNGTDDFGFSALPGGSRSTDGSFDGVGSYGHWWSATEAMRLARGAGSCSTSAAV